MLIIVGAGWLVPGGSLYHSFYESLQLSLIYSLENSAQDDLSGKAMGFQEKKSVWRMPPGKRGWDSTVASGVECIALI